MKLIRSVSADTPAAGSGCVATIGNFDGLHLGHQRVLQQVHAKSQQLGLPATVISFEPLPFEFFQATPAMARIYPLRDKCRLLESMDVRQFVCLRFNQALAGLAAETFVQSILLDGLNVRYLVVGDDFRFGRGRQGDVQLLRRMGDAQGMAVADTPTLHCQEQQRVSSTRIRQLLQQGNVHAANELLGQHYSLSGRVRHGDKLGRTLDFPTLNLRMTDNLALRKGVYTVQVHGLAEQALAGIANLGNRPTVSGRELRLEVHLFDFNQEVYGRHICVEPLHFIRAEQRFDSLPALQAQIRQDIEQAARLVNHS